MKSLSIIFCLCSVWILSAQNNLIFEEDFSRFDADTTPAAYKNKAKIIQENGKNILRLQGGDLIPNLWYHDIGGSYYKVLVKFRYPDDLKLGGLMIQYNLNGMRGGYKYLNYNVFLGKSILQVGCNRGKDETRPDTRILPEYDFNGRKEPEIMPGKWYQLEVMIRPEALEVVCDVTGEMKTLISGKTHSGTGRYTISSRNPVDVELVRVTTLEDAPATIPPPPPDENSVGPVNAVDQAQKIEDLKTEND